MDYIDFSAIQRVLVIKLRHHGDVLITTPIFSVLKELFPNIQCDALIYQETLPMLQFNAAISQIFCIDKQWKKLNIFSQIQNEINLIHRLKQQNYDLVISLTEHWRCAWLCRLLRPKFSLAPKISGRNKFWQRSFTHLQVWHNARRHIVETQLDALRRLGLSEQIANASENCKELSFVCGEIAETNISQKLANLNINKQQYVVLHPASRWFFKCWSAEKVAELSVKILQNFPDLHLIITAAPDDKEKFYCQKILALINEKIKTKTETETEIKIQNPKIIAMLGELSFKESAALIKFAKLFIGVDSAPMHIAAAVKTPLVALFGPSGDLQWKAWAVADKYKAIQKIITANNADFPCRPCGEDGCGGGKISQCLMAISVEQVFKEVANLLSR